MKRTEPMNGKSPARLVRGALVGADGKRIMYEGPALAFKDDDAAAEPLGARVAVLVEKAVNLSGASVVLQAANFAAGGEPTMRHVLIAWRIPPGSEHCLLTLLAQLVARIQRKEKIHAVIADDGANAWHLGVEDLASVRATIEKMLRAAPDEARVIAVL